MIIDTHAHLDHIENIEQVLADSYQAGVEAVVAVSEDIASSKKNLAIKNSVKHPKIFLAMGIHPSEAKKSDLMEMTLLIRDNSEQLSAIGEIGLDFSYKGIENDAAKKDEQRYVFQTLLGLAKRLSLPVSVHSRGAWKECFETVCAVGIKKAVFHWYNGPIDVLESILNEGYYVSATPSLAYNLEAQTAIQHAPIEQILIETDSPVYFRTSKDAGFKAEPKDVFRTLEAYCELTSMDKEKALNIFNQNAKDFFRI